MSSVIELLASKKKAAPVAETMVLPVLSKEHEGACGDACGCDGDESGCCGE